MVNTFTLAPLPPKSLPPEREKTQSERTAFTKITARRWWHESVHPSLIVTGKQEEDQKLLQRIMEQNEAEHAEVGDISIAYPTITRKAQPEKIVPAKEATYYRKFKIEKKEN